MKLSILKSQKKMSGKIYDDFGHNLNLYTPILRGLQSADFYEDFYCLITSNPLGCVQRENASSIYTPLLTNI